MSFHLSPASLVDQRGSDYPNLVLSSYSALSTPAQFHSSSLIAIPHNATVPQIFVVNPISDNIFRHVNSDNAHAAIIGLVYFSMWMGALGWDIVSTIHFDIRLIKETTWSSSFSSIYSIAYLLSRYVSLSWLITAVTNSVIMTDKCDAWMKGSTALFSIAISATMLVFCLRTCSIWHMQQKIVSLVVSSWLLVVAFAVLLPVMSYGNQLPTSNFCAWHFNGLYVIGVFGALLLFDLLCLVLTLCKLNKAGWRGLLRRIFPFSRFNLDSEDVKTMLVQKTTAFFAIQFLFLISALLIYVLTNTYAYRLMNIVASLAVASSMAGRIFRRAWRQTRELAPHNINWPPSYFPAWAEDHRDAASHLNKDNHSFHPATEASYTTQVSTARGSRSKEDRDSLAFYVEGEFGPKLKSRSMSSQSLRSLPRAPVSPGANQQTREMEAGHLSSNFNNDAVSITPSTMIITRNNLVVPTSTLRHQASSISHGGAHTRQHGPAPAYSRPLGSASSSRPRTGEQERASASTMARPRSAGEMFSLRREPHLTAGNSQSSLGTAESHPLSVNGSMILFSSLGEAEPREMRASGDIADHAMPARQPRSDRVQWPVRTRSGSVGLPLRHQDVESDDQHGFVMEEKRRTFITSPPLTAGVRLSSKEVYDVDSVKAAARLGGGPSHASRTSGRPATASSVSRSIRIDTLPSHVTEAHDARHRRETVDGHARVEPQPFAFLRQDPHFEDHSLARPKTAPSWPSPSNSPSDSALSPVTRMPSNLITDAVRAGTATSPSHLAFTAATCTATAGSDEDVLLAFLNTVEQDSRDRTRSNGVTVHDSAASFAAVSDTSADDGRPRTSRGNTASSSQNDDTDEGDESDLSTVLGHDAGGRGRAARLSASARPRSAVSPPRTKETGDGRALSAAGRCKRGGTSGSNGSDGSSSGTRPSTAVGDAVKPFGYGVLHSSSHRGSWSRSLREEEALDHVETGEEEPVLGSVIQQQYAKLAARAQMPLDPPC
ncbi:uncharacterized protein UBRO_08720 [Ustilago bromivora]|uniref:Uncharacterized protein n=1 Tax=Ustilago bromivora TaxID=307758 RepID=A0A1K0HM51_9BASI|nr:uncharacterized protein UBRO_08720 [Ustilago bromivora]SYW80351.1 uncharacterized protein UBRO2_03619 [Ustilago bromivora]